jgi:cysteine desulfurase family protein (TIGR01976 family)
MTFDPANVRPLFPALNENPVDENGTQSVFFDNPAGTQVSRYVIDAVAACYVHHNMCLGGEFAMSKRSESQVHLTRTRMAEFLNAARPEEIVFGPNMTTLNFALSRAIGRWLSPGDEIVITRMDHDANVSPWLLVADDYDLVIKWADINADDATLDMQSLENALSPRTKIVATAHTSNAVGTINPVQRIAELAHNAGAIYVVDAVQGTPHVPIDVQALDCDFLLCSSYKFFGPHLGIMYGKYDLLAELPAYKVRPSHDEPPDRWETGMLNFEAIAGLRGALEYIASLGRQYGQDYAAAYLGLEDWRLDFKLAMETVRIYERQLAVHLIDMLRRVPGVTIHGITDPARFAERVPTVAFTMQGYRSQEIAEHLGRHHIQIWHGDYYAVELMNRLGHAEDGMARIGPVHYNTKQEIDRLEAALMRLVD